MPRWLGRFFYALRGKRLVRIHCVVPAAAEGEVVSKDMTIEGLLVGRWTGHYILEVPRILTSAESSTSVGGMAEIPAERVIFVEVLARGARS